MRAWRCQLPAPCNESRAPAMDITGFVRQPTGPHCGHQRLLLRSSHPEAEFVFKVWSLTLWPKHLEPMGTLPQRKSKIDTKTQIETHPRDYLEKATLARFVCPCSHAQFLLLIFTFKTFLEHVHVIQVLFKYVSHKNVGPPCCTLPCSHVYSRFSRQIAELHAHEFDHFYNNSNNVHVS